MCLCWTLIIYCRCSTSWEAVAAVLWGMGAKYRPRLRGATILIRQGTLLGSFIFVCKPCKFSCVQGWFRQRAEICLRCIYLFVMTFSETNYVGLVCSSMFKLFGFSPIWSKTHLMSCTCSKTCHMLQGLLEIGRSSTKISFFCEKAFASHGFVIRPLPLHRIF